MSSQTRPPSRKPASGAVAGRSGATTTTMPTARNPRSAPTGAYSASRPTNRSAAAMPTHGRTAKPARRSRSKTSYAASAATPASRMVNQGWPAHTTARSNGTRTAALASLRRSTPVGLAAETTGATGVLGECLVERGRVEVGPQPVAEVELRIGRLPDQEVADPLVASGPDEQVRLGQAARVQPLGDGVLVDGLERQAVRHTAAYGIHDVAAARVVERDVERHPRPIGGRPHGLLDR